jgi:hypothetical protein
LLLSCHSCVHAHTLLLLTLAHQLLQLLLLEKLGLLLLLWLWLPHVAQIHGRATHASLMASLLMISAHG